MRLEDLREKIKTGARKPCIFKPKEWCMDVAAKSNEGGGHPFAIVQMIEEDEGLPSQDNEGEKIFESIIKVYETRLP